MSTGCELLPGVHFPANPSNEQVRELEHALMSAPQVDMPVQMLIHGGMCSRTILIPAGTVLTGALLDVENVCFVFGDITVTTHGGPKRLTGFHVLPAMPGMKRVGVAHADTWWATVIRTDLTDPSEIEEAVTTEAHRLGSRRMGIESKSFTELEGVQP